MTGRRGLEGTASLRRRGGGLGAAEEGGTTRAVAEVGTTDTDEFYLEWAAVLLLDTRVQAPTGLVWQWWLGGGRAAGEAPHQGCGWSCERNTGGWLYRQTHCWWALVTCTMSVYVYLFIYVHPLLSILRPTTAHRQRQQRTLLTMLAAK